MAIDDARPTRARQCRLWLKAPPDAKTLNNYKLDNLQTPKVPRYRNSARLLGCTCYQRGTREQSTYC